MSNIKTVYIDQDGVLSDLSKTIAELDGFTCPLHWHESTKGLSDDYYKDAFVKYAHSHKVFAISYPMSDLNILRVYLFHLKRIFPEIKIKLLSSAGNLPEHDMIVEQKKEWLNSHFGENFFDELIFVKGSKEKYAYGEPYSVLIDDHPRTKKYFEDNNLPFIWHTSAKTTIVQLDMMLGIQLMDND